MANPDRFRRILYCNRNCYFDDSNGATIASRAMMEALARMGFAVEALTGSMIEAGPHADPNAWRLAQGVTSSIEGGAWTADARGVRDEAPPHDRLIVRGVPVTIHRGSTTASPEVDADERRQFLDLFESLVSRFRPDVLVNFGGDSLSNEIRARAKGHCILVIFPLHNFSYRHADPFANVDSVIVPSRLASEHYRKTLGLDCTVLPNLIDFDRVRVLEPDPTYVTFVNPSFEKGVYAFARIAEQLGQTRPEIPFLVVEARGSERTLADCGLDLTHSGNVFLMDHTSDPRQFWGVTKLCLMPSLWMENQPLVTIEAMANGIPVIGSDRGGIPEVLGESGLVLPLPEWLTPQTRVLPTAREVAPWVESILRLWDDADLLEIYRQKARAEVERWSPEVLALLYDRFFTGVIGNSLLRQPAERGLG